MSPRDLAAAAALALAGCNQNSVSGNDGASQVAEAHTAAPVVSAAAGLENVPAGSIKPETMNDADVLALGGRAGRCAVRLTEVGFPSFLYAPDGMGAIKLNGELIVLPRTEPLRFADAGLKVALRPLEGKGDAGLQEVEMVLVPPRAKDEIGYRGYLECFEAKGDTR